MKIIHFSFCLLVLAVMLLIASNDSMARVIISENYDSDDFVNWNCELPIPISSMATSKAGCGSETHNGETRYYGEIGPGRTGNALYLWRHNGGGQSYAGYLNYEFSQAEFDKHHKELYVQYYVKIPVGWNTTTWSPKWDRALIGPDKGSGSITWYFQASNTQFKDCPFSFYLTSYQDIYYTEKTPSQMGIIDGNWHSFKIHMKLNSDSNTADGALHFYVDGQEQRIARPYGPGYSYGLTNINWGVPTNYYFTKPIAPGFGNMGEDSTWNFPTDDWYAMQFDDYTVSTDDPTSQSAKISPPTWDYQRMSLGTN